VGERLSEVVIVGTGVAAHSCAFELRNLGYDGSIVMVGAEPEPPYDRTLLSKELLMGAIDRGELALCAAGGYEDRSIDLHLGVAATGLDTSARQVTLADGRTLSYDRLVIATGGSPVTPPGLRHADARVLRAVSDGERLRAALKGARRLIVTGGGFIGGEVSAAAVERGVEVVMAEALDVPLAGAVGDEVGRRIAELHRSNGVEVLTGTPAAAIESEGAALCVRLADGRRLDGDAVVIGVGMRPEVSWLKGCGVRIDRGVITDASCRTAVPGVLAAGDCARWWNPRYGTLMRVEHWETARLHGAAAAGSLLGREEPFAPVPFFWSHQHGVRFQWVGAGPWDDVQVEDLDGPHSFVARYYRAGTLTAAFAAGSPRAIVNARRHLEDLPEHAAA
jgi:3-phenylpropionate/trans-cinnamate dioxygenase ferredoxin reductase subunit